jgi:two-component system, sensor histidine kinase and response regulator
VRHELYGIDVDNLRRFLVWLVVGGGGVLLLAGGVMVWNRRLHGEVTRRKAAEQALRHNQAALEQATAVAEQANLAKGRFLANISHELRNPMNAVAGLCHLAREGAGEGVGEGRQREYLEGIQAASDTLLALLNDLLDLSRIEAGKLVLEQRPFDLPGLCEELLQLHRFAAEAKGIALRLQLDPAIPQRLLGDPMRLRQILTNLLSNGVKFTAAGEVRLRVRRLGQPAQRVSLCFEVEDTGIGVPADQYATLFQPYEQGDGSTSRRFGGTGLGLSICRQLVERMGGEIGLDTERVQGALFYFRLELPVAAGEAEAAPPCAMLSEFQGFRGARVLVVDDSPINRRVARDLLGRWGIQAGEVANGAEALAALGDADWDLVLMDIRMPEMDGYETARRIREQPRLAGLPIVALTAHALTGDREGCLQAGMNDHLTKPIEPQRLHATLCRWLQASPGTALGEAAGTRGLDVAWGLIKVGGDRALLHQLYTEFLDLHGADGERLAAAEACGDLAEVARLAHTLAGVAGSIGALDLYRGCLRLEQEAGQGAPLGTQLASVREAHRQVVTALGEVPREMAQRPPDTGTAAQPWHLLPILDKLLVAGDPAALEVASRWSGAMDQGEGDAPSREILRRVESFDFGTARQLLHRYAAEREISLAQEI